MRYALDTDTVTALQHNHPAVVARIGAIASADVLIPIVVLEEQIAGRLHALHAQSGGERLIEAYQRLLQTLRFFASINILPFDDKAARSDEALRLLYRRMGTKDRRIAAIALANDCTLVTRNVLHFQSVADLVVENWIDAPV